MPCSRAVPLDLPARTPRRHALPSAWLALASWLCLLGLPSPGAAQMLHSRLDAAPPAVAEAFEARTGMQDGRLVRNGLRSACGNNKTFPGIQPSTTQRRYDVYRLRVLASNLDPEPCLRFTLVAENGGQLLASLYHADGFDPQNLASHYVADSGEGAAPGAPTFFSAALAGGVYYLVVAEVDAGSGGDYEIEIEGGEIAPHYGLAHSFGGAVASTDLIGVETGTQVRRLEDDNQRSRCSQGSKPAPALQNVLSARRLVSYTFLPLESGCLTVRALASNSFEMNAYIGGYDSSAPTQSFVAGFGSRLDNDASQMSFAVQANQAVTVVLHETFSGAGVGQSVVLSLLGVEIQPDFSTTKRLQLTDPVPVHAFEGYGIVQTGRLDSSAPGGLCGLQFPTPALASATGQRVANVYRIRPAESGCLRLGANFRDDSEAQIAVYDGFGYSASNPRREYHAQPGQLITEIPRAMSFPVQAGEDYDIVIHESLPGGSNGGFYTLTLHGLDITPTIRLWTPSGSGEARRNPDWQVSEGLATARLSTGSAGPTGSCLGPLNPGSAGTPANTPLRFHRYRLIPTATGCLRLEVQAESLGRLRAMVYAGDGYDPEQPLANLIGASSIGDRGRPRALNAFVQAGQPIDIVVKNYDDAPGTEPLRYRLSVAGEPLRGLGEQLLADGFEP